MRGYNQELFGLLLESTNRLISSFSFNWIGLWEILMAIFDLPFVRLKTIINNVNNSQA